MREEAGEWVVPERERKTERSSVEGDGVEEDGERDIYILERRERENETRKRKEK